MSTNALGEIESQMRFTPFGEELAWAGSGESPTDFGFTGQRAERGFGLLDYNARFYSASLGRFSSADTLVPGAGNPMAWDRYAYTLNNPVRYIDPSGHDTECGLGELCPEEKKNRCYDEACNTFWSEDGRTLCTRGGGCVNFDDVNADMTEFFQYLADNYSDISGEIINVLIDLYNNSNDLYKVFSGLLPSLGFEGAVDGLIQFYKDANYTVN